MESGVGGGGDKPVVVVPDISPPGGPIFWNWFAAKVADEVVKHKDTRVVKDIVKMYETNPPNYIHKCCFCYLPTNEEACDNCGYYYCQREYYCTDSVNVFRHGCDICENCHDCCVNCGSDLLLRRNSQITCDCGAEQYGKSCYNDNCDQRHFYCVNCVDLAENCVMKKKNK